MWRGCSRGCSPDDHVDPLLDNKPGAGGSFGATEAARAEPDGNTLLMGHIGTLAVNPSIYPKLAYNPVKSFVPVAFVARVPNVLVVAAGSPRRTLKDLVDAARAQPGRLTYSLAALPDVPTVAESSRVLAGFNINTWFGIFGPAKLPADVTQRLNKAFVDALNSPEIKARLATLLAEPMPGSPEQFADFVKRELATYEGVVKASGAKVE